MDFFSDFRRGGRLLSLLRQNLPVWEPEGRRLRQTAVGLPEGPAEGHTAAAERMVAGERTAAEDSLLAAGSPAADIPAASLRRRRDARRSSLRRYTIFR